MNRFSKKSQEQSQTFTKTKIQHLHKKSFKIIDHQ